MTLNNSILKEFIIETIRESLNRNKETKKKLYIWDLDDTLVHSNSMIHIKQADGDILDLTPAQYAVYDKEPGDEFDFSEFEELVKPEVINWTLKILQSVIAKHGENGAVILTARGSDKPARQFLKLHNLPEIPIVALGDSHPERKSQWILAMIKRFGFTEVEFFDDSAKNIAAVNHLKHKVPDGVKIIARHIKY